MLLTPQVRATLEPELLENYGIQHYVERNVEISGERFWGERTRNIPLKIKHFNDGDSQKIIKQQPKVTLLEQSIQRLFNISLNKNFVQNIRKSRSTDHRKSEENVSSLFRLDEAISESNNIQHTNKSPLSRHLHNEMDSNYMKSNEKVLTKYQEANSDKNNKFKDDEKKSNNLQGNSPSELLISTSTIIIILFTIIGLLLLFASIIFCLRTTRRSSARLTDIEGVSPSRHIVHQSIPELQALMLSVQNLGCAGMERLGIPAASNLGATPPSKRDERSNRRSTFPKQHDLIPSESLQHRNLMGNSGVSNSLEAKPDSYDNFNQRNHYTSCSSRCPPHIYRHDGEFGRDRLSNSYYQNAEVKRNYIQAPPNKTVQDVPDALTIHPLQSSSCFGNLNNQKHVTMMTAKSDKFKVGEKFKGFFMKIIDNGSNATNSNKTLNTQASMPRSISMSSNDIPAIRNSNRVMTQNEMGELVLNGSTNSSCLHSKSQSQNHYDDAPISVSTTTISNPIMTSPSSARTSISSHSSPSPGPSPSPEHNCL